MGLRKTKQTKKCTSRETRS